MTCIAIMQPYFIPYPGYFRLFAQADIFVVYDCVQFPRRGYVHRNRFPDALDRPQWLTLPLLAAHRSARIDELEFADDAADRLLQQRRKFPSLRTLPEDWEQLFSRPAGPLVPWLVQSLDLCCGALDLRRPMLRSSSLDLPASLTGQDRIIKICQTLGATRYLNAPGGRDLYEPAAFAEQGIELAFLPPYDGPNWSVLHHLLTTSPAILRDVIVRDSLEAAKAPK